MPTQPPLPYVDTTAVREALAAFEHAPVGCPTYAHRVVLRDRLAAIGVESSPAVAVRDARRVLR